jgi:hypothetical protein
VRRWHIGIQYHCRGSGEVDAEVDAGELRRQIDDLARSVFGTLQRAPRIGRRGIAVDRPWGVSIPQALGDVLERANAGVEQADNTVILAQSDDADFILRHPNGCTPNMQCLRAGQAGCAHGGGAVLGVGGNDRDGGETLAGLEPDAFEILTNFRIRTPAQAVGRHSTYARIQAQIGSHIKGRFLILAHHVAGGPLEETSDQILPFRRITMSPGTGLTTVPGIATA